MNAKLMAPFRRTEIEKALKQMYPIKASGTDGFPALFFQKYWKIIGDKMVESCMDILNGRRSKKDWNSTYIALISNVKNPWMVLDFRPISLFNVSYKIVSKVLCQ